MAVSLSFFASPDSENERACTRELNGIIATLRAGSVDMARATWRDAVARSPNITQRLQGELEHAFERNEYGLAGEFGALLARTRWTSQWWPSAEEKFTPPRTVPRELVTASKLRHDAGQFEFLRRIGRLDACFDRIIADYTRLAQELEAQAGPDARRPMNDQLRRVIGGVYNRIVHLGEAPRVPRALSASWSAADVEGQFRERGAGVVIIDDFLSAQALASVRSFAMESTVWSGIRYIYGRLGAFFNDGFNAPLLLQIAAELRDALPNVITPRYPLRQIWGFKNTTELPPDSNLHADFAAVNVNFWITPDECNADPSSGGMMVYDVDAPSGWDFHTYNGRTEIIKSFLRENSARALYVPYKQNRCVIFNSDLFHGTHHVRFRPGFENQRMNVTMLYGHREHDQHHPTLCGRADLASRWGVQRSAWHSRAFSKYRL